MAAANSHAHATLTSSASERTTLFKEDRPRHIDSFISFFGSEHDDPCGEVLLDALRADEEEQR